MCEAPLSITANYALWWRKNSRFAWSMVATGLSEAELQHRTSELSSGDTVIVRIGEDPNSKRPGYLCF